jgi:hypothetical protein
LAALEEATQVAAMAVRYILDLTREGRTQPSAQANKGGDG